MAPAERWDLGLSTLSASHSVREGVTDSGDDQDVGAKRRYCAPPVEVAVAVP
jgi:hypothetical protein